MQPQRIHSIRNWRQEMAQLEKEITQANADLKYSVNRLTQPSPASSKGEQIAFYMNRGMATASTLWTLYKVYKRLRGVRKFFKW